MDCAFDYDQMDPIRNVMRYDRKEKNESLYPKPTSLPIILSIWAELTCMKMLSLIIGLESEATIGGGHFGLPA